VDVKTDFSIKLTRKTTMLVLLLNLMTMEKQLTEWQELIILRKSKMKLKDVISVVKLAFLIKLKK
jgi:hypothetical protein